MVAALPSSPCGLNSPSLAAPELCLRRSSRAAPQDPCWDNTGITVTVQHRRNGGNSPCVSGTTAEAASSEAPSPVYMSTHGTPTSLQWVEGEGATPICSVKLQAWVEMQVDKRLNQLFDEFVERELASAREDCAATRARADQLECEIGVVVEAQTKLVSKIEDISKELTRCIKQIEAQADAMQTVDKLMNIVDALQLSVAQECREFSDLVQRVADIEGSVGQLQIGHDKQGAQMIELRRLHDVACESVDADSASLEQVKIHVHSCFTAARNDLAALGERIVELRSETTAAISKQSSTVMILDEQLWLIDQRMSQRIDKLTQDIMEAPYMHIDQRFKDRQCADVFGKDKDSAKNMGADCVQAEISARASGDDHSRGGPLGKFVSACGSLAPRPRLT